MRESLLDKRVMAAAETPIVRMLPDCHVIKVGGRSILDGGRATTHPLVEAIGAALGEHRLIIGTGGGVRSRHVFLIGSDLGLPTGVLAQLAIADRLNLPLGTVKKRIQLGMSKLRATICQGEEDPSAAERTIR